MESSMIVMANGCFDVLHYSHLKLLEYCYDFGGRLIIALDSDESVRRLKGPERPIFPFEQRRAMLNAIRYVDRVVRCEGGDDLLRQLELWKPMYLVHGPPAKPINQAKVDLLAQWGGKYIHMEAAGDVSSTSVIEALRKTL